jgi:hypothetical protein
MLDDAFLWEECRRIEIEEKISRSKGLILAFIWLSAKNHV